MDVEPTNRVPEETPKETPIELIGVYHADGGVLGELRYVLGKTFGSTHCALCDITHGPLRRKSQWDAACASFPVPIRLVHLNERSTAETSACQQGTPTILARYANDAIVPMLGPDDLEVDGSVAEFFAKLNQALAHELPPGELPPGDLPPGELPPGDDA